INIGQTVNGSLGPGDPTRQNGAHFDEYTFNGFNNQLVRITLTSPAFDTFLILIESSGTVTENDDMAQGNLNSFIQRTLSGAGTHRIRVSSFHPNVQGNYTLRLE
ncbi:MAG: PPC domain-containing protein, partial [Candidatus Sumerlaeia bacterium]|nr:PPC domain-containing protein [Candidatus Sumerlaeia bacterium]